MGEVDRSGGRDGRREREREAERRIKGSKEGKGEGEKGRKETEVEEGQEGDSKVVFSERRERLVFPVLSVLGKHGERDLCSRSSLC